MNHRRNRAYVKQPKGSAITAHIPRADGVCFKANANASSIALNKPPATQRSLQHTASSAGQWKSTFQPTDGSTPQDNNSQDNSIRQKVDLYDPYDQISSESESEMRQAKRRSPKRDTDLRRRREIAHSQPEETRTGRQNPSAERWDRANARHEHLSLSPSGSHHSMASSPGVPRTYDPLCYNPVRPHERSSPEKHTLREERVTSPLQNMDFSTSVGLSMSSFPADYPLKTEYCETEVSSMNVAPPREVARGSRATTGKDLEQQSAFSCELCEVEYARLEELQEHLECKAHWDTMEHIQNLNNYDDLTLAFLQEVLMFKVRQCCHAMVDQDLEALKDTEFMTKVDMLHCAVCNVYISTSATTVKNHVSSMKHHHNKTSFCYRQKRECLDKAAVMINMLKPQLEQYREGGNPFE